MRKQKYLRRELRFFLFLKDEFCMKRWFTILSIFLVFLSCKKQENAPTIDWRDYYPLEVGSSRLYDCESIKIDVLAGVNDTSRFLLQADVVGIISDTNGCVTYAINCKRKLKNSEEWTSYVSLSIQQYQHSIVRVEENVPYLILKFPAQKGFSWDVNAYNTGNEQLAHYSDITEGEYEGVHIDSAATVLLQDFKSLYTYQYDVEQYAKHYGLLYKQTIDVESQPTQANIDLSKPIEDRITKGTILTIKRVL